MVGLGMKNKFNLPEDKFNKLKQLEKKYSRKGMWLGLKYCSLLLFLTFLSLFVNVYLFNKPNIGFAFVCGILNGFMLFRGYKNDMKIYESEIVKDVKRLFEE